MTNHALTLLMNVDGGLPQDFTVPAAELVDPAFRALTPPPGVAAVRAVLFGADPDRAMLFYRCRQLLATVHGTALEDYVTALDPRVTYRFADPDLVPTTVFRPTVTALPGTRSGFRLFGTPAPPDVTGGCRHQFRVEVLGADTVRVHRQTRPVQNPVLTFAPGAPLPLAGSGYSFALTAPAGGEGWVVEAYNRPARSVADLAVLLGSVGEPALDAVFGVTGVEPYRTFRNLWFSGAETPLRVAALVLAVVYRTEEARVR